MPASGLLTALGTAFAPAAAGATSSILGSVVAGIGQGLMQRAQARQEERAREKARKAEEDARNAEENRRAARYAGAGDAAGINPTNPDDGEQTVAASMTNQITNPHKNPLEPLGFKSIKDPTVERVPENVQNPTAIAAPRYSYDREQGRIIKA